MTHRLGQTAMSDRTLCYFGGNPGKENPLLRQASSRINEVRRSGRLAFTASSSEHEKKGSQGWNCCIRQSWDLYSVGQGFLRRNPSNRRRHRKKPRANERQVPLSSRSWSDRDPVTWFQSLGPGNIFLEPATTPQCRGFLIFRVRDRVAGHRVR